MQRVRVNQNAQNIEELAAAVAQLQRTTDFLLMHLKLEYTDDPASLMPADLRSKMSALIGQGKKGELEAVKLYRTQAGGGFTEAAAVIEDMKKGTTPG